MDAIAQHRKNLKRAEQAWVTDCDPVRRMAALRELFRDTHRLVNELLAAPGGARLPEAEELHRLLQRAEQSWDLLSPGVLQAHLADSPGPFECLRTHPAGSATQEQPAATPEFLDRPDRSWERLLWRASLGSPSWRLASLSEKWSLRDFAGHAPEREAELSRDAIVLALSCLTPTGDLREWEWHLLLPGGDHR